MSDPTPQTNPTRDEAVLNAADRMREFMESARIGFATVPVSHIAEWRQILSRLASAPAPASGGVDAAKIEPLKFVRPPNAETLIKAETILGDACIWTHHEANGAWFWKLGDFASGTEASKGDAHKMLVTTYEHRIRSALSPAATPVSEAGPVAWRWRSRMKGGQWDAWEQGRYGAEVPPFMEVEEQYALAKPASSPAGGDVHWTIESLAQWLHDETEHQESYPGCHWPEHPDDDGNRDGGFIKIVPKHAQAYFRQMAARCFGVRPFSDAYFRALKGEPALSQSTSAGRGE